MLLKTLVNNLRWRNAPAMLRLQNHWTNYWHGLPLHKARVCVCSLFEDFFVFAGWKRREWMKCKSHQIDCPGLIRGSMENDKNPKCSPKLLIVCVHDMIIYAIINQLIFCHSQLVCGPTLSMPPSISHFMNLILK